MSWLKIDDGFDENMKIEPLSDRTFRLHVYALCLCSRKLSDGHISPTSLKGMQARLRATRRHVEELEEAGLWLPALGGGHVIKDFLEYNRSREQVLEDRRQARERKAKSREKDGDGHGRSHAVTDSVTDAVTDGVSHGGSHRSPSLTRTKAKTKTSGIDAQTAAKTPRPANETRAPQTIDFAARAAFAQAKRAEGTT